MKTAPISLPSPDARSAAYAGAAKRLHACIVSRHWAGGALLGPDPGVRINYRVGRFVKSALPRIPWRDELYYLQAQGYWVLANWRLFDLTGRRDCRDIAVRCSQTMLARQRKDGAWDFPNPEWRGRVLTVEGTWAGLGLLETYRRTADVRVLDGVRRWHDYLSGPIGYQRVGRELSANYFAHHRGQRVPNITGFVLRFLADLADATGDPQWARPCAGLLAFMQAAQKPSGEFPYTVPGEGSPDGRPHFQCTQYNAFQALDLMRYAEITKDVSALSLAGRALSFLRGGLADDGHAFYACDTAYRAVAYHATALGAAFLKGRALGIGPADDDERARRAYGYVLRLQRPGGGIPYSRGDYRILRDTRSYPRYLAMILYHLMEPGSAGITGVVGA